MSTATVTHDHTLKVLYALLTVALLTAVAGSATAAAGIAITGGLVAMVLGSSIGWLTMGTPAPSK
ncbi:MAG: hypothetical protein QM708_06425 [Propioniciclava sp.]|uniref:hypothetical protein n=1 Tax=Propioniciclava sp. TaxID=2038686 RepID=UPI0039E6F96F